MTALASASVSHVQIPEVEGETQSENDFIEIQCAPKILNSIPQDQPKKKTRPTTATISALRSRQKPQPLGGASTRVQSAMNL